MTVEKFHACFAFIIHHFPDRDCNNSTQLARWK